MLWCYEPGVGAEGQEAVAGRNAAGWEDLFVPTSGYFDYHEMTLGCRRRHRRFRVLSLCPDQLKDEPNECRAEDL
jgi:hypothetical protein